VTTGSGSPSCCAVCIVLYTETLVGGWVGLGGGRGVCGGRESQTDGHKESLAYLSLESWHSEPAFFCYVNLGHGAQSFMNRLFCVYICVMDIYKARDRYM